MNESRRYDMWIHDMFGAEKPIIALLHLDALPRQRLILAVEKFAGHDFQDSVPQKFQALITPAVVQTVLVGIGAVGQGLGKQVLILKLV